MSAKITHLEDKFVWEIVPYQLDLSRNTAFLTNGDVISDVAFGIYAKGDDPETPTLLTTMVYATSYSGAVIQCDVGSGTDTVGTYILRGRATCVSGRRYEAFGQFKVVEEEN